MIIRPLRQTTRLKIQLTYNKQSISVCYSTSLKLIHLLTDFGLTGGNDPWEMLTYHDPDTTTIMISSLDCMHNDTLAMS